jgi:hypothetical protein
MTAQNNGMSIARMIAVRVSYIGPGNRTGSKVRMTLPEFGKSRILPYDYHVGNVDCQALAFLLENGIEVVGKIWDKSRAVFLCPAHTSMAAIEKTFRIS